MPTKHKVFISYHHDNDQYYRNALVAMATQHDLFIDHAVDTGDIADDLSDERIREIIRDGYLRDSTVTIVLVGETTAGRKHVDWEIYSSMFDGNKNKKSGVLVITLPRIDCSIYAKHGDEEQSHYPDIQSWEPIGSRYQCKADCPDMPDRILDNLVAPKALVSVTRWREIRSNPERLRSLVELAFRDRTNCKYDLSRPMRRRSS